MNDKVTDLSNISLKHLKGVASKQGERLAKLGIYNIQDMLLHLPLRYEDRTRLISIGSLQAGMQCVIEGRIEISEVVPSRKRMLVCRLSDGTGSIDLRFLISTLISKSSLFEVQKSVVFLKSDVADNDWK